MIQEKQDGKDLVWLSNDESFGGALTEVLRMKGDGSGQLLINGALVTGIVATPVGTAGLAAGAVTSAKLAAGAVTTAALAANAVTTAKLAANAVGGAQTSALLRYFFGVGHNGVGAVVAAGFAVGDLVLSVIDLTTDTDQTSAFEATISVSGQIQQTGVANLSADKLYVVVQRQS